MSDTDHTCSLYLSGRTEFTSPVIPCLFRCDDEVLNSLRTVLAGEVLDAGTPSKEHGSMR